MNLKKTLKTIKSSENAISTVLGIFVVLVVGILIFRYFRGISQTKTQVSVEKPEGESTKETDLLEGQEGVYTVKTGDTLWKIAEKYYNSGFLWKKIADENQITDPNTILVDSRLKIPKLETKASISNPIEESKYTVVKGDCLWKIALRAYGDGFAWKKIAQANNLTNPSLIHPGNVLTIPR